MNDIVRVDTERLRAHLEAKLPPKVRRFRLDDIPGVMRSRLGWPVAAALMERWFRGTASEMPNTIKSGQRRLIDLNPCNWMKARSLCNGHWALLVFKLQCLACRLNGTALLDLSSCRERSHGRWRHKLGPGVSEIWHSLPRFWITIAK